MYTSLITEHMCWGWILKLDCGWGGAWRRSFFMALLPFYKQIFNMGGMWIGWGWRCLRHWGVSSGHWRLADKEHVAVLFLIRYFGYNIFFVLFFRGLFFVILKSRYRAYHNQINLFKFQKCFWNVLNITHSYGKLCDFLITVGTTLILLEYFGDHFSVFSRSQFSLTN